MDFDGKLGSGDFPIQSSKPRAPLRYVSTEHAQFATFPLLGVGSGDETSPFGTFLLGVMLPLSSRTIIGGE